MSKKERNTVPDTEVSGPSSLLESPGEGLEILHNKKRMEGETIEFRLGKDGDLGLVPSAAATAAVVGASLSPRDMKRMVEDFFKGTVEMRLADLDLETFVEMHAEAMVASEINRALENGWNLGHGRESLVKVIDRKVREMVSASVAKQYRVEVEVRVVKR